MNYWLKSSLLLLPAGTVFVFAYVIFLVFVIEKLKKSSLLLRPPARKYFFFAFVIMLVFVFVKLKKEQLVTAATGRVRICICICDNASICICKNEKEQLVTTATGRIVFVRPVVAGQWTVNQLGQSLFLIRQNVFNSPLLLSSWSKKNFQTPLQLCSWSDNFFSDTAVFQFFFGPIFFKAPLYKTYFQTALHFCWPISLLLYLLFIYHLFQKLLHAN